jgi:hypothetical protein
MDGDEINVQISRPAAVFETVLSALVSPVLLRKLWTLLSKRLLATLLTCLFSHFEFSQRKKYIYLTLLLENDAMFNNQMALLFMTNSINSTMQNLLGAIYYYVVFIKAVFIYPQFAVNWFYFMPFWAHFSKDRVPSSHLFFFNSFISNQNYSDSIS